MEQPEVEYKWKDPKNVEKWDSESLLKDRDFLLLWLSQIFTQVAAGIFGIAVAVLTEVEDSSGANSSAFGVALVIFFTNIPALFFSILAGVLSDWFDRKKIMIISNVIRFVLSIIFIALAAWNISPVSYLIIFLMSGFTQIFLPAEASLLPDVVRKKNIILANSIFNITIYSTFILGVVGAGPLIKLLGEQNSFLLLGLMFLIGSVIVPFIRVPHRESKITIGRYFDLVKVFLSSIFEGFKYVTKGAVQKFVLMHNFVTTSIILVIATLIFKIGQFVLRVDPKDVGLIAILPLAVGATLGVLFLNTKAKSMKRIGLSHTGVMIAIVGFIFFSISSYIRFHEASWGDMAGTIIALVAGLGALFIGLAFPLLVIPVQTLIQEDTNEEFRGRVYGVWFAVNQALSTIPALIFGFLADTKIGIPTVLTVITIIIIIYGIIILPFRNKA